jgi:hypothetical protein
MRVSGLFKAIEKTRGNISYKQGLLNHLQIKPRIKISTEFSQIFKEYSTSFEKFDPKCKFFMTFPRN